MNNKYSKEQILKILYRLKNLISESGLEYFRDIDKSNNNYILVTCPFHSNGQERHPSLGIVLGKEKTYFHCFTCNTSGTIPYLVSKLLNITLSESEEWLKEILGIELNEELLPEITLGVKKENPTFLDESILTQYDYYCDYMWKRKLTKEVVDRFRVGYDKDKKMITFPVWDEKNNLKMVTSRSVISKFFNIPKDTDKGKLLYLLNFAIQDKVPIIGVTEAQIDALTSWGYGFPCCATLGSPTKDQINLLIKSGIRSIVTLFDNDEAGQRFTEFFNRNCPKNIMVINTHFPKGKKDINDLSKEEFNSILENEGIQWRLKKNIDS